MKTSQVGVLQNQFIHSDMRNSTKMHLFADDTHTWLYKDPFGRIQGEFTDSQMLEWYKSGIYFTPQLQLRRKCDKSFASLEFYQWIFHGNPFTSEVKVNPITSAPEPPSLMPKDNGNHFLTSTSKNGQDERNPSADFFNTADENFLASQIANCFLDASQNETQKYLKNNPNALNKLSQSWPFYQQYLLKNPPNKTFPKTEKVDSERVTQSKVNDEILFNELCNRELLPDWPRKMTVGSKKSPASTLERNNNTTNWFSNAESNDAVPVDKFGKTYNWNHPRDVNQDPMLNNGRFYNDKMYANSNSVNKDSISCSNSSSSGVHSQSSDSSPRPEMVTSTKTSGKAGNPDNIELNATLYADACKRKMMANMEFSNSLETSPTTSTCGRVAKDDTVLQTTPSSNSSKTKQPQKNTGKGYNGGCGGGDITSPCKGTASKIDSELCKLIKWSQDYLRGVEFNQAVDIPTIVELLALIDAPYEIESMSKVYLGESPKITQFIREFLERRRPYWQSQKLLKSATSCKTNKLTKPSTKKQASFEDHPSLMESSDQVSDKVSSKATGGKVKRSENQWQQITPKGKASAKKNVPTTLQQPAGGCCIISNTSPHQTVFLKKSKQKL